MKHSLIKTGDPDAFDAIKDRNGEVCLSYCRLCRKGEGELEAECNPTFQASPEVIEWLKGEGANIPDKDLAQAWIEHIRKRKP